MRQIPFAIAALLAVGAAQGETIRCGSYLVDESATVEELLRKCGEPSSKRDELHDVWSHSAEGGARIIGLSVTEYWTYERGRQGPPIVVTIVDGKIKSVERAK